MSVSAPGGSQLITATVAAPPAGSDWSYTVPAGRVQRLLAAFGTLVTSASVSNRNQGYKLSAPGPMEVAEYNANLAVTASSTQKVLWGALQAVAPAEANAAFGGSVLVGIPNIILTAGYIWASLTANLQAGDQWSAITLLIEDWGNQPGVDALPEQV